MIKRINNLRMFWLRFKRNKASVAGLLIVFFFVFVALIGASWSPFDPLKVGYESLVSPCNKYIMGTDNLGRDVFSLFLHGARISLIVGVLASSTTILIGVFVGAISGYYGGRIDDLLMRITEIFQVIPRFFLILTIVALFGTNVFNVILVIGLLSWPGTARLVRADFLSLKEREFVEAAKAIGESDISIIFREILPNASVTIIVRASIEVANAIMLEAGLSFLGLGDPNVVSWGYMLNRALSYLRIAWWMSIFPGMAILLLSFGFNVIGDGLNYSLNPRLKER